MSNPASNIVVNKRHLKDKFRRQNILIGNLASAVYKLVNTVAALENKINILMVPVPSSILLNNGYVEGLGWCGGCSCISSTIELGDAKQCKSCGGIVNCEPDDKECCALVIRIQ